MKYGIIGCGNMGGSIARALSQKTKDILVTDRSGKAKDLARELGISYGSNEDAAASCDRIFICVKPKMVADVLKTLHYTLLERKPLLISICAGVVLEALEDATDHALPVIRINPNTPIAVGKGLTQYCKNDLVDEETLADWLSDMATCGAMDALDEGLIDAASAVSGCGPAYAYMFMEALADGAVACGLPRKKAYDYAAAMLAGAAEMVLKTGLHPGALKDAVCSPGGSTIQGVRKLEENGFRGAVMDCIIAACEKNKTLGK